GGPSRGARRGAARPDRAIDPPRGGGSAGPAGKDFVADVDRLGDMFEPAQFAPVPDQRPFGAQDEAPRSAPRQARQAAVGRVGHQPQRTAVKADFSDFPDHDAPGVGRVAGRKPRILSQVDERARIVQDERRFGNLVGGSGGEEFPRAPQGRGLFTQHTGLDQPRDDQWRQSFGGGRYWLKGREPAQLVAQGGDLQSQPAV